MQRPTDNDFWAVGLGANIGTRVDITHRFRFVAEKLEREFGPSKRSSLYVTEALEGARGQSPFHNAVMALPLTNVVGPCEALRRLLTLELQLGRKRTAQHDARAIDLDLLLWGDRAGSLPGPPRLRLPHPGLRWRRFVLAPLAEVLGEGFKLADPHRQTLCALLAHPKVASQRIRRLPETF